MESITKVSLVFGSIGLSCGACTPTDVSNALSPCARSPAGSAQLEIVGEALLVEGDVLTVVENSPGKIQLSFPAPQTTVVIDFEDSEAASLSAGETVVLGPTEFFGVLDGYISLNDQLGDLVFEGGYVIEGEGPEGRRLNYSLEDDAEACLSVFGDAVRPGLVSFKLGGGFSLGEGETKTFALEGANYVARVVSAHESDTSDCDDCSEGLAIGYVVRVD